MKKTSINSIAYILLVIIVVGVSAFFGIKIYKTKRLEKAKVATIQPKKDTYAAFADEVYDIIQQNYWNKITDADLSNLFVLASQKVASTTTFSLLTKNKIGVEGVIATGTKNLTADQKKDFVTNVADVVLANLAPFGRSRLYTQKLETALKNEVNNVDTSQNMYSILAVKPDAPQSEIEKAYQQQAKKLEADNTPQAKEKLALVNRAHEALSTPIRKEIYDKTGSEPSVTYRQLDSGTFYIKLVRFTPTLIPEFQAAAKTVDGQPATLHTLIIDLRDNIGGAIDQLPEFLGPFIGQGQYAFQYFHQGTYTPFQTTTGFLPELVRYKRVIILINGQTQSSAEVMAGTLKKYNVGVLVGTPSKGWGSIERVFPISTSLDPNQTFSAFLVHTLTLADDNQPIEGKGIQPQINIKDKNWERDFQAYYNDSNLTMQIKKLFQ